LKILRKPRRGDIANDFTKRIIRRKPPALAAGFRADTNSPAGIRHEMDDVAPTALRQVFWDALLQICRAYGARSALRPVGPEDHFSCVRGKWSIGVKWLFHWVKAARKPVGELRRRG
jgi:hypothetical protein